MNFGGDSGARSEDAYNFKGETSLLDLSEEYGNYGDSTYHTSHHHVLRLTIVTAYFTEAAIQW